MASGPTSVSRRPPLRRISKQHIQKTNRAAKPNHAKTRLLHRNGIGAGKPNPNFHSTEKPKGRNGGRPSGAIFGATPSSWWQGRRESNSQPLVLETSALPIELRPSVSSLARPETGPAARMYVATGLPPAPRYSMILVTTPRPTVLPPSRMAKRTPSSMAIGLISSTLTRALSPGMHISASPIRFAEPVTSVVRK